MNMEIFVRNTKEGSVAWVKWSYYQAWAKEENEAVEILFKNLHLRRENFTITEVKD